MKPIVLSLVLALAAGGAQAACYADYKAKQDDPLKLHYGVAEVAGACTPANAKVELTPRVASDGWTLLNIVSVFDDGGLAERKDSAGDYFLRY
ncbi:MAG: hypothetical protein AAGI10_03405 [Pseudomonadota bacterium]